LKDISANASIAIYKYQSLSKDNLPVNLIILPVNICRKRMQSHMPYSLKAGVNYEFDAMAGFPGRFISSLTGFPVTEADFPL